MLSNRYFYFQLTRKYVILFGNMFNNITLKRINRATGTEVERIKIPIIYAPKEKYIARLRSDPDLNREIQVALPRMSFELQSFTYDPTRKQNSLLKKATPLSNSQVSSQYVGVPYDLTFDLHVYTRNIDDGTHIVEQIIPYFNPDYTVTGVMVPEMGFLKDIPIILNSVTNDIEHEGNFDAVRFVTWRLNFTMKVHYYGPVQPANLIRSSMSNIFNDPALQTGYVVKINTDNGNGGTFKVSDTVYQGNTYTTATAYGIVLSWDNNNNKLTLGGTQGTFQANSFINSVSANAQYKITSFDTTPIKLVGINVTPKPNTASSNSAYGYDTTITEWPSTNI